MPEAATCTTNNATSIMRDTSDPGDFDHDHESHTSHNPGFYLDSIHSEGVSLAPAADLTHTAEVYFSSEDSYSSDEDVDMDGGVPISNIHAHHALVVNQEMNMIDAEIMGEENYDLVSADIPVAMDDFDDEFINQLLAQQPHHIAHVGLPDDDVDIWSIDEGSVDLHDITPGQGGWGGHAVAFNNNSNTTSL